MNVAAYRRLEELGQVCAPKGWRYVGAQRSALSDDVNFFYELADETPVHITIDMTDFLVGRAEERLTLEIEKKLAKLTPEKRA